ncbi:hypothetical protein AC579_168 [Pseudocercospora musae]|uniref:Uncharacterized protein n=1 Tax=Pseudocercospora musae TaxID=113226 RepID=A0A139IAE0_9PEZI|nr:hypothetical protein AC579_168 [Pseudocercospora musae]
MLTSARSIMGPVRDSQLALGIRKDVPNLFRCSIDHPFMTFLRTGLDDVEEATADIKTGKLHLSPVWETKVDEFIDKIGIQLFATSGLRSRFLVNAKDDTLGGHYPKDLYWSCGTHQKKRANIDYLRIRLELRQLITCEFSRRRIEDLPLVYTGVEQDSDSDSDSDTKGIDTYVGSRIGTSEDQGTMRRPTFDARDVNGRLVNNDEAVNGQRRSRTERSRATYNSHPMDRTYQVSGSPGLFVSPPSSPPPRGLSRGNANPRQDELSRTFAAPVLSFQHDLGIAEQYGQLADDSASYNERHDSAAVLTAAIASSEIATKSGGEQVGKISVEAVGLTGDDPVVPHASPAQVTRRLTPLASHLTDSGRIRADKNEAKADHVEPKPSLMVKVRYRSKQQGKRRAGSNVEGSAKRIKTAANDDSTNPGTDEIQEIMDEKSRSSELERSAASLRPDAESGAEMYNGSNAEDRALKDTPEITNRAHGQDSGPSVPNEPAPSNSRSRIVSTAPSECEGRLPRTTAVRDPDKTIEGVTSSSTSNSPDTTADPLKGVVAKAYFRMDCPDVVYLSGCTAAADLFCQLEDIQKSHCELRTWTMCAIQVRVGSAKPFRICHARHIDRGLGALMKAVENKRDGEQVLFEFEWRVRTD